MYTRAVDAKYIGSLGTNAIVLSSIVATPVANTLSKRRYSLYIAPIFAPSVKVPTPAISRNLVCKKCPGVHANEACEPWLRPKEYVGGEPLVGATSAGHCASAHDGAEASRPFLRHVPLALEPGITCVQTSCVSGPAPAATPGRSGR
jgi:hypothetical protein